MKFYIHRTLNCETADQLRRIYPILSYYVMHDEKIGWLGNMGACIKINSFKKLIELNKTTNHPIIIDVNDEIPTIEIYDDWRE